MCHVWPTADVKNTQTTGPVLIHVITDKGRGYDPAVTASDRMHGVGKFDKATGKQFKTKSKVRFAAFGRKTFFVIFAGAASLCKPLCRKACLSSLPCRGLIARVATARVSIPTKQQSSCWTWC